MLTYLRYALTTFCFAASVGCLALWWRSFTVYEQTGGAISQTHWLSCGAFLGGGTISRFEIESPVQIPWYFSSEPIDPNFRPGPPSSSFRFDGHTIYFPLWYPALIFGLAGVGTLRVGRRFTLRSALIATTIVAGVLAMAVRL